MEWLKGLWLFQWLQWWRLIILQTEKVSSTISRRIICRRFLPSQTTDTLRTGVEPAQNPCSGFVKRGCVAGISTVPRCHWKLAETQFHTTLTSFGNSFQVLSLIKNTCWICPIKEMQTWRNFPFFKCLTMNNSECIKPIRCKVTYTP